MSAITFFDAPFTPSHRHKDGGLIEVLGTAWAFKAGRQIDQVGFWINDRSMFFMPKKVFERGAARLFTPIREDMIVTKTALDHAPYVPTHRHITSGTIQLLGLATSFNDRVVRQVCFRSATGEMYFMPLELFCQDMPTGQRRFYPLLPEMDLISLINTPLMRPAPQGGRITQDGKKMESGYG